MYISGMAYTVNVLMYKYISGMAYNDGKEKKAEWENKQKDLLRIEEAKKREAEKGWLLFVYRIYAKSFWNI